MIPRNPKNERIKKQYTEYLRHADGKSDLTIRQIEKAILRYETFTKFGDFAKFDQKRGMEFKAHLSRANLAKATILSTLTALKRFFGWLAGQPGYRSKVNLNDVEFLSLSEKEIRAAKAPAERAYPTLEQVISVVSQMPQETAIERRNRALLAFTAVTGIRDGAIISLKLRHVDAARRLVVQHPRDVATKGSKRIDTFFFPIDEQLSAIVLKWMDYLRDELLCSGNDPLFPKTARSHDEFDCFVAESLSREPWANAGPVRDIFKVAFAAAQLPPYTPHSFRNMLVQQAYKQCKTPELLKVWSQNLGHEGVLTTLTSYGKIDLHRQGELLVGGAQLDQEAPITRRELERLLKDRGL
jgi:integrase